jgi:hypothetical protein
MYIFYINIQISLVAPNKGTTKSLKTQVCLKIEVAREFYSLSIHPTQLAAWRMTISANFEHT